MTQNRTEELVALLESLARQSFEGFEVVFVANGATPEVLAILERAARADARLRTLAIARTSASSARNAGLAQVRTDLVHFLDDDVVLPPSFFAVAVERLGLRPEVGILGGPNLTMPDEPRFARLSGALLATRFGTGIARPRYAPRSEGPARESDLILCNLALRRRVLGATLSFPTLFGGEENVLMGHAAAKKIAMWYCPELFVFHRRRATFAGFVEQMHRYGYGRAHAMWSAPKTLRIAYLVPVIFVLYLLSLSLLPWLGPALLLPLGAYLASALVVASSVAVREREPGAIPLLVLCLAAMHVAYGVGLGSRLLQLGRARLSAPGRAGARP